MNPRDDLAIRLAAFEWLTDQRSRKGDVLSRADLLLGFEHAGRRYGLMSPQQGIWKPAACRYPLSITTTLGGPYTDAIDEASGRIRYSYQGSDPNRWDNAALRSAKTDQIPLVYFHPVVAPGRYLATYPVYVVGDMPDELSFWVQMDDPISLESVDSTMVAEDREARRAYVTSTVRRRLHQASFRERVLRAYRQMCALCRLRHSELLDAAHITADSDPTGEPHVSNGLALCKLHHAAFDGFFFTVTPDYRIEVRPSLLAETDGPMLIVGLQDIHGQPIQLPSTVSLRPDRDRLASRLELFRQAS